MKERKFIAKIENKTKSASKGDKNGDPPNIGAKIKVGKWEGKTAKDRHEYTPYDECPRCSEYQFAYYVFKRQGVVTSNKVVRGGHCRNCGYTDEVDKDPSKARKSEF